MIKRFTVWRGESSLLWFVLDNTGQLWIEDSFRDAIARTTIVLMNESVL